MTATNHVITGIVLATAIRQPAIALPLAFVSHFVLDAIPHFGNHKLTHGKVQNFSIFLAVDMAIAASLLLVTFFLAPQGWQAMVAAGVLAASPDLMWVPEYISMLRSKPEPKKNWIKNFHSRIQCESPSGAIIELVWFFGMMYLLAVLIVK